MSRVISVASREYTSTVTTKGFLFGILLMPLLMVGAFTLMPLLLNKSAPKVSGTVAVIDRSGEVGQNILRMFSPEEITKRHEKQAKAREHMFDEQTADAPIPEDKKALAKSQIAAAMLETDLSIQLLPKDANAEDEKKPVGQANAKDLDGSSRRLALVVIPAETVTGKGEVKGGVPSEYAKYELFTANKLDFEVSNEITSQVDKAIVDARIARSGMDAERIRGLMSTPINDSKTVTATGEQKAGNAVAGIFVPMGFMMLLWISVFTSGQYLLTSLIEEKSNRVMELLLSAVSPMQLMCGKILGQMWVGLTILFFYGALSGSALVAFKYTHLIDPMSLVYLAVYFLLAFTMISAMMASIGSAVSDVREAQSLMGPAMIILMIPMILWMPLQRNPNSVFAQVLSFVPPINPFVMVLRLTGAEKVPTWQIPVSMLVGVVACYVMIRGAAKIFRVGVLMYGKPPNLLGLLKWIRYA